MPTVEEYTDPYVSTYVPTPRQGEGVCDVCHGAAFSFPGFTSSTCDSCDLTRRGVTHPLDLVVPISLYCGLEQLHTVLRDYKDSPDEEVRARHRLQVAAMLARFLRDHGTCTRAVAGRGWDTLTIVPSTGEREGAHPLEVAVKAAAAHRPLYRRLLARTDEAVRHREANERAYRVTEDVRGRAVLLIDDTFTTGARIQSCASALTLAGADVVGAVVVGRFMRPEYSEEAQALWDRQRALRFDFETCCVHTR